MSIIRHFHCYVLLSQWYFVNEEWVHSVTTCKQEYVAKYRVLIIQETSLDAHINRFVRTGSVNKEKSRGRPSVPEETLYILSVNF